MHLQVNKEEPPASTIAASSSKTNVEAKKDAVGHDLDLSKIDPVKVDLNPEQFQVAVSIAQEALATEKTLREVAHALKRKFDEKYEPLWHCIVGRNFGSYMSHGIL